jgi:hypothetical protein
LDRAKTPQNPPQHGEILFAPHQAIHPATPS